MNRKVYLDHNASTPVHPEVVEAMLPYWSERFGNPSSVHGFGREAREGLETAREQVAHFLRVGKEEIVFTSGGTESDNMAIKGVAMGRGRGAPGVRGPLWGWGAAGAGGPRAGPGGPPAPTPSGSRSCTPTPRSGRS